MKKILITGASGFIGHFLVDEAQKRDYDITIAVRPESPVKRLKNRNIEMIQFDFSDEERLNHAVKSLPRFDYIIHNAGLTKALSSEAYFEVNLEHTKRFIGALTQHGRVPEKFLFMSSLAAFGPAARSGEPVCSTSTPKPVTSYGRSKLAAEIFITQEAHLPYLIIRPTAVYGPGEKDIFQAIKQMSRGLGFQAGTQNQCLTFIYVKDLARLVFDALESPQINKAYFAADGNLYGSRDLGQIAARLLGRRIKHVVVPVGLVRIMALICEVLCRISQKAPVLNREKVNELSAASWNCDVTPLGAELNFRVEYDLEAGMRETIDWYRKEKWIR